MPHGVAKKKNFLKGWKSHCLHQALWKPGPQSWETHPVGANVFTREVGTRGFFCAVRRREVEPAGLDAVSPQDAQGGDGGVAWC